MPASMPQQRKCSYARSPCQVAWRGALRSLPGSERAALLPRPQLGQLPLLLHSKASLPPCRRPPGIDTVTTCASGYLCMALSSTQIQQQFGDSLPWVAPGELGVCAYAPTGLMLPGAAGEC